MSGLMRLSFKCSVAPEGRRRVVRVIRALLAGSCCLIIAACADDSTGVSQLANRAGLTSAGADPQKATVAKTGVPGAISTDSAGVVPPGDAASGSAGAPNQAGSGAPGEKTAAGGTASASATPATGGSPSATATLPPLIGGSPAPGGTTGGSGVTGSSAPPASAAFKPYSVEVVVSPDSGTMALQPPTGATPAGYATSLQLTANVLLSNNTRSDAVTWKSNSPEVATVNTTGLVTAGTRTGSANIVATSIDGRSTGTASVIVSDDAALDLQIQ